MQIQFAILALTVLTLTDSACAEEFWSHKDWHVSVENARCRMVTGGDGNDTFSLSFERGGFNAAAAYEPLTMRGYAPSVVPNDELALLINRKPHHLGDELSVHEGRDEYGDSFVAASIPSGLVGDLIAALKSASSLEVQKTEHDKPRTLAAFSLSGFTATLLKAAEWCEFDPQQLPAP